MVFLFIQPQYVCFISSWVAYFRKCFKTPFTISVGACELPECSLFASHVVGCSRKEQKRFVLSLLEEDAVDLHCPLATTCGEIIQILSKTWMYHFRSFFQSSLFGYVVSCDSCVGYYVSRYYGTSRNWTCSNGFHQRSYETESRAYDWYISAPRRDNWKV